MNLLDITRVGVRVKRKRAKKTIPSRDGKLLEEDLPLLPVSHERSRNPKKLDIHRKAPHESQIKSP